MTKILVNLESSPAGKHIEKYYERFPTKESRRNYIEQKKIKDAEERKNKRRVDCSNFKFQSSLEAWSNNWGRCIWQVNGQPISPSHEFSIQLEFPGGIRIDCAIDWDWIDDFVWDHGHKDSFKQLIPFVIYNIGKERFRVSLREQNGFRFRLKEYFKAEDHEEVEKARYG